MRYENNYLSSNGRMSTSAGSAVANSTARYTPFGDWRTEPTASLTNRGYTGHLHNNLGSGSDDLGLIYMNARYYLPSSGRFISPDTIVPDPTNPQQYNRYTYTLNNPIRFVDPTGHNCAQAQDDPSVYNYCKSLEQQILASTVRIEMTGWYVNGNGNGVTTEVAHATVVDGQHILTHNHFTVLPDPKDRVYGGVTSFTIKDTEGNVLFGPSSATDFNVVVRDSETLLIDLGVTDILNLVGVPPAEFATANDLTLAAGQEVGKVDWDGQSSFVEWTTIEEFIEIDGPLLLHLIIVHDMEHLVGVFIMVRFTLQIIWEYLLTLMSHKLTRLLILP